MKTDTRAGDAERQARARYAPKGRTARRITLAEVDMADLKPGTIRRSMQEITYWCLNKTSIAPLRTTTTNCNVQNPIWVRPAVELAELANLTPEQIIATGSEVWLSIAELMKSGLQLKVFLYCAS
jgi:hypothetical protein